MFSYGFLITLLLNLIFGVIAPLKWGIVHDQYFGRDMGNRSPYPKKYYTFMSTIRTSETEPSFYFTPATAEYDHDAMYSFLMWKQKHPEDTSIWNSFLIKRRSTRSVTTETPDQASPYSMELDYYIHYRRVAAASYYVQPNCTLDRYNESFFCEEAFITESANLPNNTCFTSWASSGGIGFGAWAIGSYTAYYEIKTYPTINYQPLPYCITVFQCFTLSSLVSAQYTGSTNPIPDYCLHCYNAEDKHHPKCSQIIADCPDQIYKSYLRDFPTMHYTCRDFLKDRNRVLGYCADPDHSDYFLCIDCNDPKKAHSGFCEQLQCYMGGKDTDKPYLCSNFIPNCSNPLHEDEPACLDCEERQREDPRCKMRNCTRYGKDRGTDLCKKWKPNCFNPFHALEDLCLDCLDKDKDFPVCKARKYDCADKDKDADICYYSTTTTEAPVTTTPEWEEMQAEEAQEVNLTNPMLGKLYRHPDYFASVTVPVFVCIALTTLVLFVLLHLPKCCLGLCREPDWETYGYPPSENQEYEDPLYTQPLKK